MSTETTTCALCNGHKTITMATGNLRCPRCLGTGREIAEVFYQEDGRPAMKVFTGEPAEAAEEIYECLRLLSALNRRIAIHNPPAGRW